jgi:hypothetical protein
MTPSNSGKALADNLKAFTASQDAAQKATDANVTAQRALDAINANPQAFTQSSTWANINNNLTKTLGFSPFTGVTNSGLTLSQAMITKIGAVGLGTVMHQDMGLGRPAVQEFNNAKPAVENGTMPFSTLAALMQAGMSSNNSTIAEGRIAQRIWNSHKYAAIPGSFTGAMTTVQSNLENGKYPSLYSPQVSLGPTNAPLTNPGGGPPGSQPAQAATASLPNISDAASYAKLAVGQPYMFNGVQHIKTQ